MKLDEMMGTKRHGLNMALRPVASAFEMHASYLQLIERGDRFPSDEFVMPLAEFLEVSCGDLLKRIAGEKLAARIDNIPRTSAENLAAIERWAHDQDRFRSSVGGITLRLPKDKFRIPTYWRTLAYSSTALWLGPAAIAFLLTCSSGGSCTAA